VSDVTLELAMEASDKAMEIARLKAENDRLRDERDHWHVEQVHAYGNWEDAYKRATELEAENAKLRELLRIVVNKYCESGTCDGCPILGKDDSCPY
jgi:uncharacterized coiled-coil DUF342 family protein